MRQNKVKKMNRKENNVITDNRPNNLCKDNLHYRIKTYYDGIKN